MGGAPGVALGVFLERLLVVRAIRVRLRLPRRLRLLDLRVLVVLEVLAQLLPGFGLGLGSGLGSRIRVRGRVRARARVRVRARARARVRVRARARVRVRVGPRAC